MWPDALIDLTRSRRKSQTRSGAQNGARKPPLAPSTWIGNVETGRGLEAVERFGDRLDRLVAAGEGHAEGRDHADGVLVAARQNLLGRHQHAAVLHGDLAVLDIPIAGELVPADLHGAGDQVRFVEGFALGASAGLPATLERETAKHRRLAGAGGRAADAARIRRRVPEIREHVHATRLDLGGLRILVLVDHVLVDAVVHQLVDLGLAPRLAEGREILPRVAVEQQFVPDGRIDIARIAGGGREPVLGKDPGQIAGGVGLVIRAVADRVLVVQGHRAAPGLCELARLIPLEPPRASGARMIAGAVRSA